MKIDNLITINKKDNFLLLKEILHDNHKYFFSVRVNDEKTKPINDYAFLEYNNEDVNIVTEKSLIDELYDIILKDFINS